MQQLTLDNKINFMNKECAYVGIVKNYNNVFQPYHGRSINIHFQEAMNYIKSKMILNPS